MNTDKLLPQHDLDERNSLGRATPAEWSTFVSGRASITEAGREALGGRVFSLDLDAAIQPLFSIEADLRKVGYQEDVLSANLASHVWRAIEDLQGVIGILAEHGR